MKGQEFDTKNAPISFIDLEMTGLESAKHEIVEIGLVKVFQPGLEVMETWEAKVRPEHLETADPEALKISGYDPEAWKDAISLQEMMTILSEKSKGSILAGFVPFADYAFLDAAVTRTGIPLDFHRRTLDVHTYVAAKMGYDRNESGLSFLCQKLGIDPGRYHTALADAMACYEVYKRVASR